MTLVMEVRETSQVGAARRAAAALADRLGFGAVDRGRVAMVATELGTNLLKHGGGGKLLISAFADRTGQGVELIAIDRGPGIANVDAALRDGHSTTGTPGTGLGAIIRGSHEVDIYSRSRGGTAVLARLQPGKPSVLAAPQSAASGAIRVPKAGETVCGDAWAIRTWPGGAAFMVADGLGHGPDAALASTAAVAIFERMPDRPVETILEAMHEVLGATRGAAIAVGSLDRAQGRVVLAGIGNIAAIIVQPGRNQRMISRNGTIGHAVKQIQAVDYAVADGALIILASDGLSPSWSLDAYPGLQARHPSLIAAMLYRDHDLGRDDVSILVIRTDEL